MCSSAETLPFPSELDLSTLAGPAPQVAKTRAEPVSAYLLRTGKLPATADPTLRQIAAIAAPVGAAPTHSPMRQSGVLTPPGLTHGDSRIGPAFESPRASPRSRRRGPIHAPSEDRQHGGDGGRKEVTVLSRSLYEFPMSVVASVAQAQAFFTTAQDGATDADGASFLPLSSSASSKVPVTFPDSPLSGWRGVLYLSGGDGGSAHPACDGANPLLPNNFPCRAGSCV